MRFKERSCRHNIKVQGEVTCADIKASANYSENLVKITNESGHTK